MTITSNSPEQRQPNGRTVRDIIERSPAQVNEVWCRKILRQLLQSLDAQYTRGEPHRLIMPDTIVVRASGDAILLPDPDANADFQPEVGADLRALAAVIHYAITHEMPAAGPLTGRALAGYSDSLLGAVDRCMAPNRSQRPQTVAELRDLLGMVSVGLLKPSAGAPAMAAAAPAPAAPAAAPATPAPAETHDAGPPAAGRKWLWLGLAAVLLGGALYIVRQHGAEKLVGAAPVPTALPGPARAASGQDTSGQDTSTPAPAAGSAIPAATSASAPADKDAAPASATYRLNVKPWGTIYVDGKRRGVSPPLKRLILAAGRHTVMVENPGFADHIVQLNSTRGGSGQITHEFSAQTDSGAQSAADAAPATPSTPVN